MSTTDKAAAKTPATTADPASGNASPQSIESTEATGGEPVVDERWKSVLIVARGSAPESGRRPVIVVQNTDRETASSSPKGEADYGSFRNPTQPPVKSTTYPKGADVYFAVDAIDFGEGRLPVVGVGMGRGVVQTGFPGFAERLGQVHVGPSSPVFAAANYAYTRGAKRIEIVGLKPEEVEVLRPWFTEVSDKAEIVYGG